MIRSFDWDSAKLNMPRSEYPRPSMVREHWQCLNGVWEFSKDQARVGISNGWYDGRELKGKIVVPFAYQYPMSGHDDKAVEEVVWYAKTFHLPDGWIQRDRDVLLHFGAVDYQCTVWVNGREIGHNQGGHVPFSIAIGQNVKPGENRVCLRVVDEQDPYQPRGKQAVNAVARGCDYYCTTGIWQTVWLESVPSVRIENLVFTPLLGENPTDDSLECWVLLHAPALGLKVRVEIFEGETVIADTQAEASHGSARLRLPMPNRPRWSPDSPALYDVKVSLIESGQVIDQVRSYTGMRSVGIRDGQILVNGEPVYLKMVLDQGYWPESGMTAPSDEAIRADVEWLKRFGFNGVRKHQKVEDPRWLYWCDKFGVLVWGEMANSRAWSTRAEEQFVLEWERAVRRDLNHPCIIAWVPLNESWGVPGLESDHPGQIAFVERLVSLTRRLDATRPVVDNDGWEHTDVSDIFAIHDYTPTGEGLRKRYSETQQGGPMISVGWGDAPKAYFASGARYRGQPVILSEVGGFLSIPEGVALDQLDPLYGAYGMTQGSEDLVAKYRDIMEAISDLSFVKGFCYTQLTDIEQEMNGLLAYDRRPKVDPDEILRIHREMERRRAESAKPSDGPIL